VGARYTPRAMLRAIRHDRGRSVTGGRAICAPGAPLWIDCTPDPENLAWLAERFGFHPLALEDCAHEEQRTKFEEYPESAFMVFHRLSPEPDESGIQVRELHAFLGADFLVTVHTAPIGEIDRIFDRCTWNPDILARGPDHALYLLWDAVTDIHFAVVEAFAENVEEMLAEVTTIVAREEKELLDRILHARSAHVVLRRRLAPQRDLLAALLRLGEERVRPYSAPYLRDVHDHLQRLTEEVDAARDLLASAVDVHFSSANMRLAATTTRLTLVATIFLPLNFVAGFFGMNLDILPPRVAIPIVLALILTLPFAMLRWFKRRGLL
jgi:magnesium transporter